MLLCACLSPSCWTPAILDGLLILAEMWPAAEVLRPPAEPSQLTLLAVCPQAAVRVRSGPSADLPALPDRVVYDGNRIVVSGGAG